MQISRIIIEDYQQFDFLDIDLTYPKNHPKEGKILEKICLIGKNGTGKTTLIELIKNFLINSTHGTILMGGEKSAIKLKFEDFEFYIIAFNKSPTSIGNRLFNTNIETETNWIEDFRNSPATFISKYSQYKLKHEEFALAQTKLNDRSQHLLIYSPSEVQNNLLLQTSDLPTTNLNDALNNYKNFPYYNEVSFQNVNGFWNLIIFQVKQRESDEKAFFELEENQTRIIADVKRDFSKKNPFFLNRLSNIWNRILSKAGLFFDTEKVTIPMQLTENLIAYIKIKSNGQNIAYSRLSTGIRHYIFRLGYIASLYFNRRIKSAIAIIDEPENSLFPDMLYDLVDQYTQVSRRTQFFYATHSPIIAAQFEPCERIIFDFDKNGKVFTSKGKAAIGDEPNDLLIQDFGIESLLGKEGIKNWERYVELKILIRQTDDEQVKEELVEEYLKIGQAYNF